MLMIWRKVFKRTAEKNIKMEKRMTEKSENDEDEACGDLKKFKQI